MSIGKVFKSKKMRYGSLSAVFTIAFIAIVIALNLILTAVASNVNLTVDLTQENLFSVGDETKAVIDTISDDLDITIYFLADRDLYAADQYMLMVVELAEEYANLYPDKIKIEYKDIDRDPEFAKKYLNETLTTINASNVIVEGKFHARVLTLDAFFYLNDDSTAYYAFAGEIRFTGAILQCSIEEPQVITFTEGHNEQYSNLLKSVLTEAGFELQYKDLSYEEIDSRTRILIVSNPTKDFTHYESSSDDISADEESDSSDDIVSDDNVSDEIISDDIVSDDTAGEIIGANDISETEKIGTYLGKDNGYNSLIVLVNSTTPTLPTLEEYLLNNWGIGYHSGHRLTDTTHSVGNNGTAIVGKYVTTLDEETGEINKNMVAYNIHKTASTIGTGAKTIFKDAVELYSNIEEADQSITIETVLATNDTAICTYLEEDGTEVKKAAADVPLMLVSSVFDYGENNAVQYGYVMLVSSTDFASNEYLTNQYGNNNVLLGTTRVMGTEQVIPDLEYKTFIDEAMTIELGIATVLTWLVSAVFPIAIIVVGLVVFFKRRHL